MAKLNEVPTNPVENDKQDIAYFEAKIAASGKSRDDPVNAKYVKIIETLRAQARQVLLG